MKKTVYIYNGPDTYKDDVDAMQMMFAKLGFKLNINPGSNYEGAKGIFAASTTNLVKLCLNAEEQTSFWNQAQVMPKVFFGSTGMLTCPTTYYNEDQEPISFSASTPILNNLPQVPNVTALLGYSSIAQAASETNPASRYAFDMVNVTSVTGSIGMQPLIASPIYDCSRAGADVDPIATLIDPALTFAWVHHSHHLFCIGGQPHAAFALQALYDGWLGAGASCTATPCAKAYMASNPNIAALQKTSIDIMSAGLFKLSTPAQQKPTPELAVTIEYIRPLEISGMPATC